MEYHDYDNRNYPPRLRRCICDKCGDTGFKEYTLTAGKVTRVECDCVKQKEKYLDTTSRSSHYS